MIDDARSAAFTADDELTILRAIIGLPHGSFHAPHVDALIDLVRSLRLQRAHGGSARLWRDADIAALDWLREHYDGREQPTMAIPIHSLRLRVLTTVETQSRSLAGRSVRAL